VEIINRGGGWESDWKRIDGFFLPMMREVGKGEKRGWEGTVHVSLLPADAGRRVRDEG
jgi:hypothetical protein